MDQRSIQILFALLRSAICGTILTEEERNICSFELIQDLLKISDDHDITPILAMGLKQNGLVSKENSGIEKHILKAVYRYERLRHEYENLCNALEKAQIPFLPLKGSVIRKYYPEAWMRTSCDIDILVREEDTEKAKMLLVNEYGYICHGQSSHDVSLFTPTNIHIELHYDLVEDGSANKASEVLKNVWNTAVNRDSFSFWYEMPDEMYYFYHLAHMAKHFENGGCGIRPFIDLWILDNIQGANVEIRNKLLEQGELLKFADVARKLSRVWLENEEYDAVCKQMDDYILRGGVYGNDENRIIVQQQKNGGRLKYALSKIFISYDEIKFLYPILQKHRWLTPIMEVRRWFKLIFCGQLKHSAKELKYNSNITDTEAQKMQEFLNSIGLSEM